MNCKSCGSKRFDVDYDPSFAEGEGPLLRCRECGTVQNDDS